MTKFYLLIFSGLILFAGCKSASKAYEKGNYADAFELGVKKLQKDPDDWETRQLVQNAYNYAISNHEDRIRILGNSRNDNRYAEIYREYLHMQDMYNTIRAYPNAFRQVRVNDYSSFLETYGEKSATVHIQKAEQWLQEGTRTAFREAYHEYHLASNYLPHDFQLRRKKDSVYNLAVTKVLIVPLQNYGGYSYASSYRLQNLQNDIFRALSHNIGNEFVRFYSQWEAVQRDVEPDQVLELNIGRITIGQPHDRRTVREVSKEVVIREIVYRPDSVVKQYGTVKARITTTQRTLQSEGDLYITLRDTKGRTIWNDRFTGQHRWNTEFATYTGDERALSDSDKNLLNKNNEYNQPREDEIMDELFREIQSDLSRRMRNYYSRY